MMSVNCCRYTVAVSVHWRIRMGSNSTDNCIECMEEFLHGVINLCTFFCLRKGIKCILTETLTYLAFNSIFSDWHLVKALKVCLALDVVTNPFLGLCVLLTRKGGDKYLSNQKFISCELRCGNLLKLLRVLCVCSVLCFLSGSWVMLSGHREARSMVKLPEYLSITAGRC